MALLELLHGLANAKLHMSMWFLRLKLHYLRLKVHFWNWALLLYYPYYRWAVAYLKFQMPSPLPSPSLLFWMCQPMLIVNHRSSPIVSHTKVIWHRGQTIAGCHLIHSCLPSFWIQLSIVWVFLRGNFQSTHVLGTHALLEGLHLQKLVASMVFVSNFSLFTNYLSIQFAQPFALLDLERLFIWITLAYCLVLRLLEPSS